MSWKKQHIQVSMTDVTALTSACRWITHRERGDVAGAATARSEQRKGEL